MFLKKIILGFSLVMTGVVCGMLLYLEQNSLMSIPVLSEEETQKLCEQRQNGEVDYQLCFENIEMPVYKEGKERTYLISQGTDEWRGDIRVEGECKMIFPDRGQIPTPDVCVRDRKAVEYIVYNDKYYQKGYFYVTSLPLMLLETETSEGERTYGNMELIDTSKERGDYITESSCEYHVRGSASRVYYKQGYKLNLLDASGNGNKQQLLDLRKDDDWILRAMGLDESKIREQLATEIWNEINTFGTYEGRYMELFQDGVYKGLYLLHEPMDFKTIGVDSENHFLVQVKTWPEDSDFWNDVDIGGGKEHFNVENLSLMGKMKIL